MDLGDAIQKAIVVCHAKVELMMIEYYAAEVQKILPVSTAK